MQKSRRQRVYERDGGQCFYCRQSVPFDLAQLDHFVPRSRSGINQTKNRVLACVPCNVAKDDFDPRAIGLLTPRHSDKRYKRIIEAFRSDVASAARLRVTYATAKLRSLIEDTPD